MPEGSQSPAATYAHVITVELSMCGLRCCIFSYIYIISTLRLFELQLQIHSLSQRHVMSFSTYVCANRVHEAPVTFQVKTTTGELQKVKQGVNK